VVRGEPYEGSAGVEDRVGRPGRFSLISFGPDALPLADSTTPLNCRGLAVARSCQVLAYALTWCALECFQTIRHTCETLPNLIPLRNEIRGDRQLFDR
jgi:hypothetical protein